MRACKAISLQYEANTHACYKHFQIKMATSTLQQLVSHRFAAPADENVPLTSCDHRERDKLQDTFPSDDNTTPKTIAKNLVKKIEFTKKRNFMILPAK